MEILSDATGILCMHCKHSGETQEWVHAVNRGSSDEDDVLLLGEHRGRHHGTGRQTIQGHRHSSYITLSPS
jgi:hypothetical protein